MKFGLLSGALWALDTTILSIALAMTPFSDSTPSAIAYAAIVSSAFHDVLCATWLAIYMAIKGKLAAVIAAVKTRSGKIVAMGALLGGPIGMSGYVMAINLIGPSYTAIISAFYPAFGTIMAVLILKEKVTLPRIAALCVAMLGVGAMGIGTISSDEIANPILGFACAILCVVGWGSEAVFCAWGMRDDAIDNEIALQIRELVSAVAYLFIVLPLFGAYAFVLTALPTTATSVLAISALAGTLSYLFYYKAIGRIGAARGMALNISYSAWAVLFGLILLGSIPSIYELLCCAMILAGTILASCDWKDLLSKK